MIKLIIDNKIDGINQKFYNRSEWMEVMIISIVINISIIKITIASC